MAVQVEPTKPHVESAWTTGTKRLKLKYDEPPSNFAFIFGLRRYCQAVLNPLLVSASQVHEAGCCNLQPIETRVESAWSQRTHETKLW